MNASPSDCPAGTTICDLIIRAA